MFEQTFKNIDNALWKDAGASSELDYTEQTSWILFLKYLDDLEQDRAMHAELVGTSLYLDSNLLKIQNPRLIIGRAAGKSCPS